MHTSEPRIIKKYPNRRLYDTAISSYITLEDVKRLVIDQIQIKVVDARTIEDITHSTLLQIIIEQEESGPSLFTIEILQQMIRSYGGIMQQWVSKMFAQGMEIFSEHHQAFPFKKAVSPSNTNENKDNPVKYVAELAKKNMLRWQDLQQQWMDSFLSQLHTQSAEAAESEEISEKDPGQPVSQHEKK